MVSLKALKIRIGSVKSTQKITKAMKMVAAAKLRRAQEAAEAGRPYAATLERVVASLASKVTVSESSPKLLDRLKAKARKAGLPVCGGNGMGFYNFEASTFVSHYQPPQRAPGSIAFIAHSGSAFDALVFNDARYRFNFAVSSGQEINASVGEYMDYALDLPSTPVIALFLEAVRDPRAFVDALAKARSRDVPVIVVKVGRTEQSAKLAPREKFEMLEIPELNNVGKSGA